MNKNYWFDLLERTARTFVQGFLSVVTFDVLVEDFQATWLQKLAIGALAGALAILTSFAAKGVASRESASFIE